MRLQRFDADAARAAFARLGLPPIRVLAPDNDPFFSRGTFGYRPAAHDGWVFVKGSGILDKRSFLRQQASERERAGGGATDETDGGSSVLDLLSTISLIVLAIVLVLGVIGLVRRVSVERR